MRGSCLADSDWIFDHLLEAMSNVNMVEKKSLKLGNKALLVVKGHGIHPKGLAQKLRMKKRLRFSGSHRKERVIKLPDACLPCNKLY